MKNYYLILQWPKKLDRAALGVYKLQNLKSKLKTVPYVIKITPKPKETFAGSLDC